MRNRHQRPGPPAPRLEVLEDRTALSSAAAPASAGASFDRDHILVQYRQGQPAFALPGTSLGSPVGSQPGLFKVNLGTGVDVSRAVAAYRAEARVAEAEPDYLLVGGALPNDPRLGEQWGLRNIGRDAGEPGADIGASRAWVASTGSTKMVVAVMDTGVDYTHPDLYLNIWLNQGEIPASRRRNLRDTDGDGLITFRDLNNPINKGRGKITDLNHNGRIDAGDLLTPMRKGARGVDTGLGGWANGRSDDGDRYVDDLVGWNFADNNNKPRDDFGHGTQVAGVIGAVGNNGVGVAGVAWRVQMMPVKFMNSSGSGSISDFIDALDYAVAHGAKISNNSWAGADNSSPLADAIRRARGRGGGGVRGHLGAGAARRPRGARRAEGQHAEQGARHVRPPHVRLHVRPGRRPAGRPQRAGDPRPRRAGRGWHRRPGVRGVLRDAGGRRDVHHAHRPGGAGPPPGQDDSVGGDVQAGPAGPGREDVQLLGAEGRLPQGPGRVAAEDRR